MNLAPYCILCRDTALPFFSVCWKAEPPGLSSLLDFSGQRICNPVGASCSAVSWLCNAPLLWSISAVPSACLSCSQAVAFHVSSGLSHFLVFCGYWYSGEQVWPRVYDPDLSLDLWSRISLQQIPSIPDVHGVGDAQGVSTELQDIQRETGIVGGYKTTAEAKKLGISGSQHASQHFLMLIINYLCLPAYTGKHYNWKLFPTQKFDPSTDGPWYSR